MRPARIRQLEKLRRELVADGHTVDIKTRSSHNSLLIIVSLKDGDEAQLIKAWDKARRTE